MNEDYVNQTTDQKAELYRRQKELLNTFLEHGTITKAQYDKSLGDLTVKMGMEKQTASPSKMK